MGAGGEVDDRGWDGWMASQTRWTWVWVNSRRWWWTGRPGVLRFMGSRKVGHDWATELNFPSNLGRFLGFLERDCMRSLAEGLLVFHIPLFECHITRCMCMLCVCVLYSLYYIDISYFCAHFLESLNHNLVFNFIKSFSALIENTIWFLFFNLLMWCITLIDLWILKNPCIPWYKSHLIMVYGLSNVLNLDW